MPIKISNGVMATRTSAHKGRQLGFTLIEITIAVVMLSIALITFLGMQASAVKRELRDKNVRQAMLFSRRILASIEKQEDPLENKNQTQNALQMLKQYGVDADEQDQKNLEFLEATLTIENWGIPAVKDDAFKKVTLTSSWSPDVADYFEIVYFVPNPPPEALDE